MPLTFVSVDPPIPGGRHRSVDCVVGLDATYPAGGYPMNGLDFGLSTVTGFDDVIGEGWVVRCDASVYPPRLKVLGMDPGTINMEEVDPGSVLGAIDTVQLRVYGW